MSIEELVRAGGDRVVEHAPFGARTTYRVGGTARALVTLSRSEDLTELAPPPFQLWTPDNHDRERIEPSGRRWRTRGRRGPTGR